MQPVLLGLRYAFAGFNLIGRPGIRQYVLVPLAINMVLFAAAIVWGMGSVGDFIRWLSRQWEWLEWIAWLLWPLFVVIALILIFFSFSIIANLLGSPFNGFLAAAVERTLAGTGPALRGEAGGFIGEMRAAVSSESRKFLYFAARALPLSLLFAIPLINIAAAPVWFLFGAWMLALEYLEYPLGNRGLLFPEVRAQVSGNRRLALGFGIGVLCLTLIPVLNFLAMPVAVAGGTKLVVERFPAAAPS